MSTKNSRSTTLRLAMVITTLFLGVLYEFVPYGDLILYPFTLLFTWVHEMGHGMTALLTGGTFLELHIYSNAAGVAQIGVTSVFASVASSAGGLLAPPIVGMAALIMARSWARLFLAALSLMMIVSLAVWVRTWTGVLTVGPLAILCFFFAISSYASVRIWCTQFLGMVLLLFTIVRMDYLFTPVARGTGSGNRPSDISAIADVLGGPYQMWGGILACISIGFLLFGLYIAWREPRRK